MKYAYFSSARMTGVLAGVLAVALFATGITIGLQDETVVVADDPEQEEPEFAVLGEIVPHITLSFVDSDEPVPLPSLYGRPIVLYFWATWCDDCTDQLHQLAAIQNELAADAVHIVAVNMMETKDTIAQHASGAVRIAQDDGHISRLFDVKVAPAYYLIAADGTLQKQIVGSVSHAVLQSEIQRLLTSGQEQLST